MSDVRRAGPKFPLRLDQMVRAPKTLVTPPDRTPPITTPAVSTATAATTSSGTGAPAVLRPQRLLHEASRDEARRHRPSGLGLDSAGVRERMAARLHEQGVRHEGVLKALATVPRHAFVDPALVTQAYEDTSLPIGHGQTISKPSVVARMLELAMDSAQARAGRVMRALEIGTGCGYQAALMAQLARQVVSVERVRPLHDKARALLAPLGIANLRLVYGDGMLGHAPSAPYDIIVAAAGGEALPPAWLEQLAVGGRIVAPVHESSSRQVLVVVDRTERGYEHQRHEAVQFVPLKSGLVR